MPLDYLSKTTSGPPLPKAIDSQLDGLGPSKSSRGLMLELQ